eukprot:Hpha_TRINITY_DN15456_c0_g2::TRINITY_DN15456_c0_g2_i1::g.176240::m.176240
MPDTPRSDSDGEDHQQRQQQEEPQAPQEEPQEQQQQQQQEPPQKQLQEQPQQQQEEEEEEEEEEQPQEPQEPQEEPQEQSERQQQQPQEQEKPEPQYPKPYQPGAPRVDDPDKPHRKAMSKARFKMVLSNGLFFAVKTFSAMALTTAMLGTALVGILKTPTVEDLCHAAEGEFEAHSKGHSEVVAVCAAFAVLVTVAGIGFSSSGFRCVGDSVVGVIVFEFVVELCVWGWRNVTQAMATWTGEGYGGQGVLCGVGLVVVALWTLFCPPAGHSHHHAEPHEDGDAEEVGSNSEHDYMLDEPEDVSPRGHPHHHDHRSLRVLVVEVVGVCTAWSTAKLIWSGIHELKSDAVTGSAVWILLPLGAHFLGKAGESRRVRSMDLLEMAFAVFAGVALNEYILSMWIKSISEEEHSEGAEGGHGEHEKLSEALLGAVVTTLGAVLFIMWQGRPPKRKTLSLCPPGCRDLTAAERARRVARSATRGRLALRAGSMVIGWVWEEFAAKSQCHDVKEDDSKKDHLFVFWLYSGLSVLVGIPVLIIIESSKRKREETYERLKEDYVAAYTARGRSLECEYLVAPRRPADAENALLVQ